MRSSIPVLFSLLLILTFNLCLSEASDNQPLIKAEEVTIYFQDKKNPKKFTGDSKNYSFAWANVCGNAEEDLIVGNPSYQSSSGIVQIFEINGTECTAVIGKVNESLGSSIAIVGDIDNNGLQEVAVGTNQNIILYDFSVQGQPVELKRIHYRPAISIDSVDIDNDGVSEIISIGHNLPANVYSINEDTPQLRYSIASPPGEVFIEVKSIIDVNGDNIRDLLIRSKSALEGDHNFSTRIYSGANGGPILRENLLGFTINRDSKKIEITTDVDNDGNPDIIQFGGDSQQDDRIHVYNASHEELAKLQFNPWFDMVQKSKKIPSTNHASTENGCSSDKTEPACQCGYHEGYVLEMTCILNHGQGGSYPCNSTIPDCEYTDFFPGGSSSVLGYCGLYCDCPLDYLYDETVNNCEVVPEGECGGACKFRKSNPEVSGRNAFLS